MVTYYFLNNIVIYVIMFVDIIDDKGKESKPNLELSPSISLPNRHDQVVLKDVEF